MKKAFEVGYRAYFIYADLAAAYALAGKMDDAKSALAERTASTQSHRHGSESMRRTYQRSEGLRKAGLPEE